MPVFRRLSELPVSAPEAFAWHARPAAFERLAPPWQHVRMLSRDGGLEPGARLRLSLRAGPLRIRWEARHGPMEPGRFFTDEQVRGPFAAWLHTHRFIPHGDFACLLEDEVDFRLPLSPLGPLLGTGAVLRSLEAVFRLRHARTAHDLARHARYAAQPPLTVVVSGASGLVGRRLCAFLTSGGHTVRRLVRRAPRDPGEIAWNPAAGELDPAALEGVDAIVHLGGANLAERRWSEQRKHELWASRVGSTSLLARTLADLQRKPRVFVVSSAIGYYGDSGETPVDESAPRGEGFLAELCEAWEASAEPARQAGIRTVPLRTGLVIAGEDGVVPKLAPLFALGLGGPLGSGEQRMSWIALEDLLTVLHSALYEPTWEGPINAVAPEAPTNQEFTRSLARVLRRPAVLRVPAGVIRMVLGQLGREALLAGQRVVPTRLQEADFTWRLPQLEDALAEELGRAPLAP
ncbi:MAG TPA: TIGR01777 family oxidoreductase [bacterium]|nr:TIGR01777 family oxidoreductase [bacterium]